MPGNTFLDQLIEAIDKAQKEAEASQRASQSDVEKARREMAREKMKKAEKEKSTKKQAEKTPQNKTAAYSASKKGIPTLETSEGVKSPLGEKFDARKMIIYSEIMNPKYKD